MNENIIAWNVPNWVTVILMASIGFFIVGVVLKWKQTKATVKTTNTTVAQSLPG